MTKTMMMTKFSVVVLGLTGRSAFGFLQQHSTNRVVALPRTMLKAHGMAFPSSSPGISTERNEKEETMSEHIDYNKPKEIGVANGVKNIVALISTIGLFRGPLVLTVVPYVACLLWALPSSSIVGSWKSKVSMAHRAGGTATLVLPMFLVSYHALTGQFPSKFLYLGTVAAAAANLVFGAALICRRVPGYDIPTLRAFAVGVSLGFAFLGHSLIFVLGAHPWYRPFGILFSAVSVYAAMYSTSDALQHAWNFAHGQKGSSPETLNHKTKARRFWNLPFEKAKLKDVFLSNFWRQPTREGLEATVSPANGVVVFTTGMTALFASLSILQLRYLLIGSAGMGKLMAAEPYFCNWSALQALLAVVANNFGTFAGTLVIQRRTSQKEAGTYNAIGLLVPVANIIAFLAVNRSITAIDFCQLMMLPSV